MILDETTALRIQQIAENLGLPITSANEFLNSIAGVDLSSPVAGQGAKIWRDCGLPVETFNFMTDADAINWVNNEIIPDVQAYINSVINEAAIPFGYPIPQDILRKVYPNLTDSQIEINISGWEVYRWNALKFICLYHIYLLADSLKGEYLKKANELNKVGQEMLDALVCAIKLVLNRVPGFESNNPSLGVLTIKLKKSNPNRIPPSKFMGW